MTHLKHTILSVFMLLALMPAVMAQGSLTQPYEGMVYDYTVDGITTGVDYVFYVASNIDGSGILDAAATTEFDFLGDVNGVVGNDGLATATIQWNTGSSLNQYQVWLEVSSGGCLNMIHIGVSPLPNNRSIGFDVVASNECYTPEGNGFELPVSLLTNNGGPLPEKHYPVNVTFTVNGVEYGQALETGATALQIAETMFTANYTQDTQVLVEITGATDVHSAEVFPGEENNTHTRILFAIPEIEFTQQLQLQKELNEKITAHTMYSSVSMDWQKPGTDYTRDE